MKKHSLKEWLIATRPWSFPASAMPVIVTLAYLYWSGHNLCWSLGLWALANIIVFHAAGNTWSDYFDYKRGVDAEDTYGMHTLTAGEFTPQEIFRLSWLLLGVALLGGLGLLLLTGWPLLVIGVAGTLLTVAYPPLKYCAWGDAVIFATYAILPMIGTSFVAIGSFDWQVLWNAVPVGLITVAILHANNTRDIPTDRRAHITTLAMKLGTRVSMYLYCFEILFPFVWIIACSLIGLLPLWSLIVLPVIGPAVGNVNMVRCLPSQGEAAIARLDEATAKLQLLFSLVLSLSIFIATWLG